MEELNQPFKTLSYEDQRARVRFHMQNYLNRIKSDPEKYAAFKTKQAANYRKFYAEQKRLPSKD